MIHVTNLSKRYGRRQVLADINAHVANGRITALLGANGAGKTTFIKVLLGLARADHGTIVIDGQIVGATPAYRGAIGYMPQIVRLPAHQTGRELLAILTAVRGGGVEPDVTLAEAFGLGDQFDRPLGELSGGTRQKVNAVLAFAFRPSLLVLDEPTAGLDPLGARVLKDRLQAERARGTAVLITSHVLPDLEELADDILMLSEGTVAWAGELRGLMRRAGEPTLERAVARVLSGKRLMAAA